MMISRIDAFTPTEIALLEETRRGKQILSYYDAYGAQYDFCRFFRAVYDEGFAILFHFNATLLIYAQEGIPTDEIAEFTQMHMPFRIECSQILLDALCRNPHYQKMRRTTFALVAHPVSDAFDVTQINRQPKLDDVYEILQDGFPNIMEYSLWLTDISHRCRHGMSRVYTYRNCSTLTHILEHRNTVLVGQVATKTDCRGSGYARDFLKWTAAELAREGKTAYLYALDIRRSFYEEIGFIPIDEEYVLERADVPKETPEKGALE